MPCHCLKLKLWVADWQALRGFLSVENISAAKTPGNGGIKADSLDGNENGLGGGKYVTITFDDGPKAGTTDLLLNGLRNGASMRLFLIGKQVEENETLCRADV